MNEFQLKYGTNPNQKPARIYMADGSDLPVQILNGRPGYINFLDAFNSWQLVRDLKKALGQPAAASFKHVSPAGAAIGLPLDDTLRAMYHIAPETELSPLACAYARARGADRMSSFGDWIALSDVCDLSTAKLIQHEVSDGIIAPGYDADALEVLKSKKKGNYAIVQIDAAYEPKPLETRTVFGVTFEQGRQDLDISNETMLQNVVTENKVISDEQRRDLIISLDRSARGLARATEYIGDVTHMLSRGQLKINMEMLGSEEPMSKISRIVNRLTLGMITAGTLVSAALVSTITEPTIAGLPVLSFTGYCVGIGLTLWIIVDIIRHHGNNT